MPVALLLLISSPDSAAGIRRIATAPAETLRTVSEGQGPPVVILPGMAGGAFGWRLVAQDLVGSGHRVVIIEPLGTAGSGRPAAADYSLAAQAIRIGAVLDTLGVRGAVLVSHGGSGGMAFRLALRRPDLVDALVSVEAGPGEEAATPGLRRALKLAPLIRLFGGGKLRGKIEAGMRESSGDPSWVTGEVVRAYTRDVTADVGATLRALRGMARAIEPYRLADSLGRLTIPMTILLGGASHPGGPSAEELARLRQLVPTLTEEVVPGAGHYIQEERPGAIVSTVLRTLTRDRLATGNPPI